MRTKFKILIIATIIFVSALTLILVLLSLDRLGIQFYGLNYNTITADFTDSNLYKAGLYYVGISNKLLEVMNTPQLVNFIDLKTYTSDFYPLKISAEIVYNLNKPNGSKQEFAFYSKFYQNFGNEPQKILIPIFTNEIITLSSSHNSLFYQSSLQSITSLELAIETQIESIISIYTSMNITVLIYSIVCQGLTRNTQAMEYQIQGIISKTTRIQQESIEMGQFTNTAINQFTMKINKMYRIFGYRADQIERIIASSQNPNIGKIMLGSQMMYRNFSFASSQLLLRPQLYIITNQSSY